VSHAIPTDIVIFKANGGEGNLVWHGKTAMKSVESFNRSIAARCSPSISPY